MKKQVALIACLAGILPATACASPQSTVSKNSSRPFVINSWNVNPGGPMNPLNSSGNYIIGMDVMPLTFQNANTENPSGYWPALASHWKVSGDGSTVTVWLQPNAKWSDGTPVTANDVKMSAALYSLNGVTEGYALGSVQTVGNNEVIFKEAPNSKYGQFAIGVLGLNILPASVYSHLLPSNIWTLINSYQYTGQDSKLLASQQSAGNQISVILKKVSAVSPPKDVSAGPYTLKQITPGELQFVKNPDFYAADKIRIGEVDVRASSSNQQIFNWETAGQIQLSESGGMTPALVKRIERTQGNTFFQTPGFSDTGLAFDENIYPYNLAAVRQALAYVINKHDVWSVGEPEGGSQAQWTSGMTDFLAKEYLTSDQLAKLNPYTPNTTTAAKLLRSAGFTQKNGNWYMPNGQPFTMSIHSVSGYNDWDEGATVIQSELNQFGIPTKVELAANGGVYYQEYTQGKYAAYMMNVFTGPYVESSFGSAYGSSDGYNIQGGKLKYTPPSKTGGMNFVGFPQTVDVTGYGTVNPGELTYQLTEQLSDQERKKIVQTLAFTTNEYVPYIALWNNEQAGFANEANFTNYPLNNQPIMELAETYVNPVGIWQALGYVQPK